MGYYSHLVSKLIIEFNKFNNIYKVKDVSSLFIELDALYSDENRFYHNWDHIYSMYIKAETIGILNAELFGAILFHDAIYDPKRSDNEVRSAGLSYRYLKNDNIVSAIKDTITHIPTSNLGQDLIGLDLYSIKSDLKTFINTERKIFKEYQFVDYSIYKEKRIEVLSKLNVSQDFISYVETYEPKIGVYPGSFNPFHKGHFDILIKAEQVFDKVIIARGINPNKNNEFCELPNCINNRQVDYYDGLLSDYLYSKNYDTTLIRGLRNSEDLQYEITQSMFLKDLKSDLKIVSFFCDKQYEHISSSAIRTLQKYNKGEEYLCL